MMFTKRVSYKSLLATSPSSSINTTALRSLHKCTTSSSLFSIDGISTTTTTTTVNNTLFNLFTIYRRRGSARGQVFGDHGTMRAQGLLRNTKWAWGPYQRWSRHPDETHKYFTAIGFHGRYPEAIFRDRVQKLGMGFVWPTQPFGWPSCVFIFYYLLIIQLFPCYCLVCTHFTFIFTKSAH